MGCHDTYESDSVLAARDAWSKRVKRALDFGMSVYHSDTTWECDKCGGLVSESKIDTHIHCCPGVDTILGGVVV